ncbi:VWA domain-containing protein [Blastopirellula sp. J2-11]|uniref:VWA domain-containing protein n=1 Tax=Blastopirellula sp. J2-11 TaxID=2943192 RepID=UPI0021C771B0|nr:VWA domain-containing protein [Blastopirellula sp. J2-11]UUO04391.1 VWA domain-containing protein [Blastopirellula sp. J2-11]
MDIQLGSPSNLGLIALAATGLIVTAWAIVASRRAAGQFAMAPLRRRLIPSGATSRRWTSAILVSVSLAMIAIALLDVRWGKIWREAPQKGIEVMFVLDVSRSMLAEDVTPNRLQRAKQQIKDMLEAMTGDRVGLIAFAGATRQSVPLTSHYEDFKQTLDSVGPHSVRSGGSRLGDAIAAAADGFINTTNDHKAIVVFTDGEDQESKPVDVAKKLYAEQGIRVFTVGLGDMDQGARIPESEVGQNGFMKYQGQQVWTKLNGQVLEQIATESNGAYVPAGTRHVNMADVYRNYLAQVEQTEFETAKINVYIPRFQWFAAPALALLLLEVFLSSRNSKLAPAAASHVMIRSSQKTAASNASSASTAV